MLCILFDFSPFLFTRSDGALYTIGDNLPSWSRCFVVFHVPEQVDLVGGPFITRWFILYVSAGGGDGDERFGEVFPVTAVGKVGAGVSPGVEGKRSARALAQKS